MDHSLRSNRRSAKRRLCFQNLQRREMLAADLVLSEFMASNNSTLQDGYGRTSDWIEIHNAGDMIADLSGWHLTDDPNDLTLWSFPTETPTLLAAGEYLVVFASGDGDTAEGVTDPAGNLHTSFALAAEGDYVALVRPDSVIVDEFGAGQIDFPSQRGDISYGIDPSVMVGDQTRYFPSPTPGAVNSTGVIGFVDDTAFSVDRGYFTDAFSVQISSSTADATLIYTMDGSAPSETNGVQVIPSAGASPIVDVLIQRTTTLRAAAFKAGFQPTNIDTQTYLFLADVITQSNDPLGFPIAWGTGTAADYGMDPEITDDPAYNSDLLAGLKELPALSLVSDIDGLFGSGGIYSNPLDDTLEIPISAEYLLPDGASGFQIDAGLKIAGGASRSPSNSPKHSMSLRFRSTYGKSKLQYDLFSGSPVNEFNSLQLRAVYNNSWIHWDQGQRSRGTLIRDQFVRDSLIAAGQDDAGRGHYTHVYINGLYWGVYNLHERAEAAHYAQHNGGEAADYDALNGGVAIDGTILSWDNVKATVATRQWSAINQVLDVDNFIDWMLAQVYGGNADLKVDGNWRAAGGGTAAAPWRMYAWDSERILEGVNDKPPQTITDATGLFNDLILVPEFIVRFGDRVQKHFTGNGAFTPAATTARWNARAAELRNAIVAESARWGDYRRDVHPRGETPLLYRRDQNWTPEVNRVVNQYFPNRTNFVLDRLKTLGWISSVDVPEFRIDGVPVSGGVVAAGASLRMTSDVGMIYYTTNDSDPRSEAGQISPDAIAFDPSSISSDLVAAGAIWRYDDSGMDLGSAWRSMSYDDAAWSSGLAELGFGDGDEATLVSYGSNASDKHRTTYFRKSFQVSSSERSLLTRLTLRLRRDDGAAVYLNGVEIARDNLPAGMILYSTKANAAASDDGNQWFEFDVPIALLRDGANVIAAEIHQNSETSSDLSFDAALVAQAQVSTPLSLNESLLIRARVRDAGGQWSAIQDALFLVPNEAASASTLRISEIHYDPAVNGDAEYLEFRNISSGSNAVTIDLDGIVITDGPSLPFVVPPNTKLAPGESAVVVHNSAIFSATYPTVDPKRIIGQYIGKLSNSGERIRVTDASGALVLDLTYGTNDPWPKWADGRGGSLVLSHPAMTPAAEVGKPYHYRGSAEIEGSPAADERHAYGVMINEVLAHTDSPLSDSIEFYNPTNSPIDVGGWFVSDDGLIPTKYRIAGGTVIPAGGYLILDESDFNPPLPDGNSSLPFALNGSGGDSIWLFAGDGSTVQGFSDHVTFDATFNGVSLGRLQDSNGRLVPLANRSLGTLNGMFQRSDLVISEVHYHPSLPIPAALLVEPTLVEKDLEFIEIQNAASQSIGLADWRLRGEGDFDFASADVLSPGEAIVVVSFDPANPLQQNRANAFRTQYGISPAVRLVGPFAGSLSNSHGVIKLQAPDSPPQDDPTWTPHVTVDELYYDDLFPWPIEADGSGKSLQRIAATTLGNFADSWRGEIPTPGDVPVRAVVESVQINDGSDQRSSVTGLKVSFDRQVDFTAEAFSLLHRASGIAVSDLNVTSETILGKTIVSIGIGTGPLTINRNSGNSLIDGNYELRMIATEIRSSGTEVTMAADYLFGSEAADRFFRLFGDSDGDRDVDAQDYGRFGMAFMQVDGGLGFDPSLDYDGDGDVDGLDRTRFTQRFGRSLRPSQA